jgi:glucokinase
MVKKLPMVSSLALAVDIGGTHIKAGLIQKNGELLGICRIDTPAHASPEYIVREILEISNKLFRESDVDISQIDGVGVSLAGFVTASGMVTATAHLSREWVGYDLNKRLMQDFNTNLYFALDTPAPTIGEAYYGAGKDLDDFIYITVSTGIGAGIISGKSYYTGGLGWAGGVGHTIIDEKSPRICQGCGNHGCLETFAAKQGIIATTLEQIMLYPQSQLAETVTRNRKALTPKLVFEIAARGDETARQVFKIAGHALGIGLTNLTDIVAPTRIVVGGGIAQAGDLLLEPAREVVRQRAFPPRLRQVEIVQAALGDLSGIYGAAAMVFHDLKINMEE